MQPVHRRGGKIRSSFHDHIYGNSFALLEQLPLLPAHAEPRPALALLPAQHVRRAVVARNDMRVAAVPVIAERQIHRMPAVSTLIHRRTIHLSGAWT